MLTSFQLLRRKKNCNCAKPWKNYVPIKANNYQEAVDIAVRMNRANNNYSYKVKTT